HNVVHEPHAARAEDASIGDVDHVTTEVFDGIESLRLAIPSLSPTFLIGVVLKLALAGLVTDRAVERVVDEKHLEHALSRLERLLRVDAYYLPLGHRGRARGRELRS